MEARAFFSHVISPFIDKTKTENSELLEHFMLHMMKDEMKSKEDENRQKEEVQKEMKAKRKTTKKKNEEEDKEEEGVTNAVSGQIFPMKHILILSAKRDKKILRVAGSEHSVSDAIFFPNSLNMVDTLLLTEDLRKVEIQEVKEEQGKKWLYCRIGAGCLPG